VTGGHHRRLCAARFDQREPGCDEEAVEQHQKQRRADME
jgi:hypothetical protein